ncbi:MAG: hypothetical protein LBF51_01340 [Zoogloeaceae bacterium]|jgi:hypothetical protein|nr:hypothetical protein [Zoogloeaceae bacterium]
MPNIHDATLERRLAPLIEFAQSEGWQLHYMEDGQIELRKPGLPPIHIGMNDASTPRQGRHGHD